MESVQDRLEFVAVIYYNKAQWARKYKKNPGQKTSEIKLLINFTNNFFDQIQFFAISKMAKNQFLNWEIV